MSWSVNKDFFGGGGGLNFDNLRAVNVDFLYMTNDHTLYIKLYVNWHFFNSLQNSKSTNMETINAR